MEFISHALLLSQLARTPPLTPNHSPPPPAKSKYVPAPPPPTGNPPPSEERRAPQSTMTARAFSLWQTSRRWRARSRDPLPLGELPCFKIVPGYEKETKIKSISLTCAGEQPCFPVRHISIVPEVVELWRAEKIHEVQSLLVSDSTSPGIPSKGATKLKVVLEFHWQKFLEGIGFWMPSDVANTVVDDKPDNVDELEIIPGGPMPPECHAELHTDYAGAAVRWGLTHHTESAADCCQACLDQAKGVKPGEMKCNIWVYCPSETGCYSPDIYEHKHQECWLKQDEKPRLSFKGEYSDGFRSSHPTAPLAVPWMSGVIR